MRLKSIISFFLILLFYNISRSQYILQYDSINTNCNLIKYEWLDKKNLTYPITGEYSPTMWGRKRTINGIGISSYIYFETDSQIQPGLQYTVNLLISIRESFLLSKYFNSHFGIAFCNTLPLEDDYGLWNHSYTILRPNKIDTINSISFNFRTQCKPKYVVFGVFADPDKEDLQENFAAVYKFKIHNFHITKSEPTDSFIYVCNEFEEEKDKIATNTAWRDTSIYFSQGSFDIDRKYDTLFADIPKMNLDNQSIFYLDGYTNKSGSKNVLLGEQRNNEVLKKLLAIGIDSARIIMINYDEQKATTNLGEAERRVSLRISEDKLYQKYYTLYRQSLNKDVDKAKILMGKWLELVPPKNAIYALFDCYNEESMTTEIKNFLYTKIVAKFYKNNKIKFKLDSLWCEDQKIRTLERYIMQNHLSSDYKICEFKQDDHEDNRLDSIAEVLYEKYNFPEQKKYGKRANETIPYIIIHSSNMELKEKFLPFFLEGAEQKKISWQLYATLYDKIAIEKTGLQRYGTQYREIGELYPFDDEAKVKEFRKQVGLGPLSDK